MRATSVIVLKCLRLSAMPRFLFKPQHIEFLRSKCGTMPALKVCEDFERLFGHKLTYKALNSAAKRYGFRIGHPDAHKKALKYTDEQIEWLREKYQIMALPELTKALNKRFGLSERSSKLRAFLKNHKITCDRSGRFKKGQRSWNKGRKGINPGGRAADTQFKEGHKPHNHVEVGTEVISSDGYRKVKVAEPNSWEFVHRKVWQKHKGSIPDGMFVRFLDGNPLNCEIDNLALVDRGAHAIINRCYDPLHSINPDVRPVIVGVAMVSSAINKRKREAKGGDK